MRKIKFKKFIPHIYIDNNGVEYEKRPHYSITTKVKDGTGIYSDFINEGLFHQWGIESDGESLMDTIGIIEISNGAIKTVSPSNIQFVE